MKSEMNLKSFPIFLFKEISYLPGNVLKSGENIREDINIEQELNKSEGDPGYHILTQEEISKFYKDDEKNYYGRKWKIHPFS